MRLVIEPVGVLYFPARPPSPWAPARQNREDRTFTLRIALPHESRLYNILPLDAAKD